MCARRPTNAMPKASFLCERAFSHSMVVMCRGEVGCGVRWSNVVGREVTSGEVMWLVARCHVMWCHVIWCDVISCVVLRHVMQCDVMWCARMWWAVTYVKWCDAMGWDLMSLWCDVAGCDVTLSGCKWLCDVVNWKMIWWSVLESTTLYYKVLCRTTQYYKVLLRTTKYYKVLLRTTKC